MVSTHPGIQLRDDLARNGLAFLHRAAEELEARPHEALVHLAIGVELLLKARLAHEHWTLVDERPGDNSLAAMQQGTPRTVGFDKLVNRITHACCHAWPARDRDTISTISSHRNKVVHFYHPVLNGTDEKLREDVALQQCRGWELMDRLLRTDWATAFPDCEDELDVLRRKFARSQHYLQARFETASPRIEVARTSGHRVQRCFGCGFEAHVTRVGKFCIVAHACEVCDFEVRALNIRCRACGAEVEHVPEIGAACGCGTSVSLDAQALQAIGLRTAPWGHCWLCLWTDYASVFLAEDTNTAVCLRCCQEADTVGESCTRCDAKWVGQRRISGRGCPKCRPSEFGLAKSGS